MLKKVERSILAILLLSLLRTGDNLDLKIKFTNLKCITLDPSHVVFPLCQMKAIQRDTTEFFVTVKLLKPILNATLRVELFKLGFVKPIWKFTIDCCTFLSNSRRHPLAKLLFEISNLEKYSNVNHSCPYDHDIILEHLRMNRGPLSLLPVQPSGEYTMHTMWWTYEKHLSILDVTFHWVR